MYVHVRIRCARQFQIHVDPPGVGAGLRPRGSSFNRLLDAEGHGGLRRQRGAEGTQRSETDARHWGAGGMAMGFIDSGWIYRISQISTNMIDFVPGIYNIHKLIYIGDLRSEIKREYHRQRVRIIIDSRHISYIKYK